MFFLCYRLEITLFLANKSFVCSVKGEVWEVVDDVHCLRADIDDSTGNVIVLMEGTSSQEMHSFHHHIPLISVSSRIAKKTFTEI